MKSSPSPIRQTTGAAMLLGLPLAAGLIALFQVGPLSHTLAARYIEHPVQWAIVCFFSVGVGALLHRLWLLRAQHAALDADLLPAWDGKPQPVARATELLAGIERRPLGVRRSWLGRRLHALLGFVALRGSVADIDDQMRTLSDTDAATHDAGYAFLRFVTWAIPILGFLGTVLGITTAIGGVSPDALQNDMSSLTGGLAEAFDSTALALGLTMLLMFFTNMVERSEQAILEAVDALAEEQVAHRFAHQGGESAPVVEAIREQTAAIRVLAEAQSSPAVALFDQVQARILGGMGQAMEHALAQHAQRLGALEQHSAQQSANLVQQITALALAVRETGQMQQAALMKVAECIAGQAAALGKLQEGEANLVHLQAVLHQNLAAIAGSGNFEQALHSLTAAVHMLTARAGTQTNNPRLSIHGAAA